MVNFDWNNIESNQFNISRIENHVNADKLFACFLLELESKGIDVKKEFTIEEITSLIPRGTAGVNNYATYGFSIMSMLSGQKDRDYFMFINSDLKDEFSSICNNNYNRDNYYWRKNCLNETCKINPKYIKSSIKKRSTLTEKDYKDFLLFLYFGKNNNYLDNCISRAYRDFNRTMHGFDKATNKNVIYICATDYLKTELLKLQNKEIQIRSQDEFDIWHKTKCLELKDIFNDKGFEEFYIGQAQKWINMALKYIFVHGESKIDGFQHLYEFCHIPIDNIILSKLKYNNFDTAWSRIDDYKIYMNFQNDIRLRADDEIPLDFEFRLFMK